METTTTATQLIIKTMSELKLHMISAVEVVEYCNRTAEEQQ